MMNNSPVDKALKEFKNQNGYDFFKMLHDSRTRNKHRLKQYQIPDYHDDNFLEQFQTKQV